jgi:hypothetical protein
MGRGGGGADPLRQKSDPRDLLGLLRLGRQAKDKEHGADQNCGFEIVEGGFKLNVERVDQTSIHCCFPQSKIRNPQSEIT